MAGDDAAQTLAAMGTRLRVLRERRGRTLADGGGATSISPSTLSRIELEVVLQLAKEYGAFLDELAGTPAELLLQAAWDVRGPGNAAAAAWLYGRLAEEAANGGDHTCPGGTAWSAGSASSCRPSCPCADRARGSAGPRRRAAAVNVVSRHRSGRPRCLPGRRGAAILGVARGDRLRIKGDLPEDLRAFGWDPLAVEHTTGQVPCCALPGHVAARTDVRPQAG